MAKKTLGCALCILDLWLNLGSLNRCQWVLEDRFEYEVFCKYILVCWMSYQPKPFDLFHLNSRSKKGCNYITLAEWPTPITRLPWSIFEGQLWILVWRQVAINKIKHRPHPHLGWATSTTLFRCSLFFKTSVFQRTILTGLSKIKWKQGQSGTHLSDPCLPVWTDLTLAEQKLK